MAHTAAMGSALADDDDDDDDDDNSVDLLGAERKTF